MLRICLIVAILAGIAVGVLNFVKVKEKIVTLQTELKDTQQKLATAEKDRDHNKAEWDKTAAKLKQTEATLATTTEERDKAVAEATAQQKRADKLTDELAKTKTERDSAQQELSAYKSTGLKPEQIVAINKSYKGLEDRMNATEDENKILFKNVARLENELLHYRTPDAPVALPASIKGKVLVADPKWNFVVLNVGSDQGVLDYGEFLVNRDGKLVAKVKVTSVQKDRCVANVVQGWQLSDVLEGDLVIPAHPAS